MIQLNDRYFHGIIFDLDRVRGEVDSLRFSTSQLDEIKRLVSKLNKAIEHKKGMQDTSHWPSKPIC